MKAFTLFVLVLTLFSCSNNKEEVKPIIQDINELVFASGELEWDNAYNLTAQTDGILTNADFEIGNKVSKGNVLAKVDNPMNNINSETSQEQLQISSENLTANSPALQQIQQNIQFLESKYQQDKAQADRYLRLFESQSIAKVELENMQLTAKNSLSQLNALKRQYAQIEQQAKQQFISTKGQLKNNQVIQNYNNIIVTESGTVIKKLKTNGDFVKKGDVIATIANEQKVEAKLNVDENNIGKIKIGQKVYIQLNTNKSLVYNGKITEILSAFDEQNQSFICKVSFDKSLNSSLYGTQLEANILVGQKKNALLIPREYVGFGNIVNVKGKKQNTIIKTGIISTDYIEVIGGIDKNTVLIPLKH